MSLFSSKIKLGVIGRKNTFKVLKESLSNNENTLWFHCASLGEYEQGYPLFIELKKNYPDIKIVLSFFSPSGYEVKKKSSIADIVVYLPLDKLSNCKKFINLINPILVVFVKSEIWPNYLKEIKDRNIKSILVSAIFNPSHLNYTILKKAAAKFDYIFTQDEDSKSRFESIGHKNVVNAGDTRYDRVLLAKKSNEDIGYIESFLNDTNCLVVGSSWEKDHEIIVKHINNSKINFKYIIAPHEINVDKIKELQKNIKPKSILFSNISKENIKSAKVIIIDNIGILSKLYKYATIAYVGGGFNGEGKLHNTLEPAVFGVPIIIGKYFNKFPEAIGMINIGGMFSISNYREFELTITHLNKEKNLLKTGLINSNFINNKVGATELILQHLK